MEQSFEIQREKLYLVGVRERWDGGVTEKEIREYTIKRFSFLPHVCVYQYKMLGPNKATSYLNMSRLLFFFFILIVNIVHCITIVGVVFWLGFGNPLVSSSTSNILKLRFCFGRITFFIMSEYLFLARLPMDHLSDQVCLISYSFNCLIKSHANCK